MSHVDNVILSISILEDSIEPDQGPEAWPIMDKVNAWLRENARGQQFGPNLYLIRAAYGGHKALEANMFVGAFNYMPEEDFFEFLRTLPWKEPAEVQYIVKREHEDLFVILQPCAECEA